MLIGGPFGPLRPATLLRQFRLFIVSTDSSSSAPTRHRQFRLVIVSTDSPYAAGGGMSRATPFDLAQGVVSLSNHDFGVAGSTDYPILPSEPTIPVEVPCPPGVTSS